MCVCVQVFVGQLPDDFLRITASRQQQQEAADRQAALALHQQFLASQPYLANTVGRLVSRWLKQS